jgi:hypothetical protein
MTTRLADCFVIYGKISRTAFVLAKVPNSPAADFLPKDETSDNRGSMQPQTHSRRVSLS